MIASKILNCCRIIALSLVTIIACIIYTHVDKKDVSKHAPLDDSIYIKLDEIYIKTDRMSEESKLGDRVIYDQLLKMQQYLEQTAQDRMAKIGP